MSQSSYRPFIRSLYPLGPVMAIASAIDPIVRVYPFHFGNVGWRFGAVGLLSESVVGVLFSVVCTTGVAALLNDRRAARVLSALTALFGLGLLAVLALFVLDSLQVRAGVRPDVKSALDASVIKAALTIAVNVPIALAIGIAGWRSTRPHGVVATARLAPAVMLNRQPKEVARAETVVAQ